MRNGRKPHYAWAVLVVCCAVQAGALGAISNCKGVFFDAICRDLGLSLGAFTLQGLFAGVASALVTPLAMRLLKRCRMHLVLFGAAVLYAGTQFAMSYFNDNLTLWYGMSVVQAVGGAFLLFLPVPLILNHWFHQKKGLAMAVASSFSGLSAMLLNPIYALVIEQYGWRAGYRFMSVLAFLLMGPLLLFVLRGSPEEKGLAPYGAREAAGEAALVSRPAKQRLEPSGRFMLACLMLMALAVSCGSCFQSHLTKYGITLGLPLETSALLPSAAMLGGILCKPLMGVCSDRMGAKKTALLFFSLNVLGFVLLYISGSSLFCLYAGSALCGVSMAANVVLLPLLVANILEGYDFDRYYGYLSMIISVSGVTASAVFGFMFDGSGGYASSFLTLIAMALVNLLALALLSRLGANKIVFQGGKR